MADGDRPVRPEDASPELEAFLLGLGRALSLAGTAVSETQERLATVAAAYGVEDVQVVAFPTTVTVAFGPGEHARIEVVPQRTGALRLDQIAALYDVVKLAEQAAIPPGDGLARIARISSMSARFGRLGRLAGYTLMTAGLSLVLRPTLDDLALAAGLGLWVGCLDLWAGRRRTVRTLIPVVAAMSVSAISFVAVRHGVADPGLNTVVAPLVAMLPGAALTTATVELASGEMVAGASRLVDGTLQLMLLAFGIVAGAQLAGGAAGHALDAGAPELLGAWAPWLGVLLFGIATALYVSAPKGALRWVLVVLLVAWLAQLLGKQLIGANMSGFVGAFAMTPVALAVSRLPGGPPSQVTFLPAFWLLVPGALGLIGLTKFLGNPATAVVQDLVTPVVSIVAIALGVLCGASLDRAVAGVPGRLRRAPWLPHRRARRPAEGAAVSPAGEG